MSMASKYGHQVTTAILASFPMRGQLDAGEGSHQPPSYFEWQDLAGFGVELSG